MGRIDTGTILETETRNEEQSLIRADHPPLKSLLTLDEIEYVATKRISKKAWAYNFSAADDLLSKRLNNQAYRSILLRPRVFVDCEYCDISTTILGHKVGSPIYITPAAMARLAHPSGEAGIAQACATFDTIEIISHNASMTPEQIVSKAKPGQVFGWQLYVKVDAAKSEKMLARVNKLADKIKFLVLTLDAPVPGEREHDEKAKTLGAQLPVYSVAKAGNSGALTSGGMAPNCSGAHPLS